MGAPASNRGTLHPPCPHEKHPRMSAIPIHDPTRPALANAVNEMRTTTCYMCACRCGIRVHLRDGEVRYIEGNPDHPLNQGVICAKGSRAS
jgi:anaerobic selenocysteine-containing dehydrogenase